MGALLCLKSKTIGVAQLFVTYTFSTAPFYSFLFQFVMKNSKINGIFQGNLSILLHFCLNSQLFSLKFL